MPGISKIPENVNKYAIEWAKRICQEPVENAKGMDFSNWNTLYDRVVNESQLIQGFKHFVKYDFRYKPHDIFVHNHPGGTPLSIDDIDTAIFTNIKKIFASTKEGYTAVDLSAIKDSSEKTRKSLELWTINALSDQNVFVENLNRGLIRETISKNSKTKMISEYLTEKLNDFCKWSGAIFENVKWTDLK